VKNLESRLKDIRCARARRCGFWRIGEELAENNVLVSANDQGRWRLRHSGRLAGLLCGGSHGGTGARTRSDRNASVVKPLVRGWFFVFLGHCALGICRIRCMQVAIQTMEDYIMFGKSNW
jgi:hypothetical protein